MPPTMFILKTFSFRISEGEMSLSFAGANAATPSLLHFVHH